MSTFSVAGSPTTRPVPWRRLNWPVWRRFRMTLAATAAVLVVLSLYLVINGEHMRSAYSKYVNCHPASSATCQFAWQNFRDHYGQGSFATVVLLFLPGIIGAFAGAPVLARELESGTFRFAWTQGVGRMRWAIAVVAAGAVGSALLVGTFGALVAWHNQPLVAGGIFQRLRPASFSSTGVAAAGWALLGYSLGVLGGVLWRRVIPTLATAFAVWFGLALLTANELRPHYLTPLKTTGLQISGNWVQVAQWWTKGGVRVSSAQLNSVLASQGFQSIDGSGEVTARPSRAPTSIDPVHYLMQHGYLQVTTYQPDSRYWAFQWIELGWLVALSLLLIGTALWLLRRKPS